jgi:UDP-N-acetylmuramyl tripeptide synthase
VEGDIVLVTGKGAEETMAIGERRIPWNDKKVIAEELLSVAAKQ